jgi:3-dehydrotetronate 4-kinase
LACKGACWGCGRDVNTLSLVHAVLRLPQGVIECRFGRDSGAVAERLGAPPLARGFSRFLVAGCETSGAVVNGLGVSAMLIGPEIDPGVPSTVSVGMEPPVALALKSGNFGADDFFLKAWRLLP